MDLKDTQELLRNRITLGLNHGLQSIEEVLQNESVLRNDFINYKCQYNDLKNLMTLNLMPYEQVEVAQSKIRMGLINLIDRIGNADLQQSEAPPKLRNTEMQYRKNNFFQLLEIHFENLNKIEIKLTHNHNDQESIDIRTGRYAFDFIYQDIFLYNLEYPRAQDKALSEDIEAFSANFFFEKYRRFEVYMKTFQMILEYIMEEEMEQDFYLNILKSVLSTREMQTIFYYVLSGKTPELKAILQETKLLEKDLSGQLIDEAHWALWNR